MRIASIAIACSVFFGCSAENRAADTCTSQTCSPTADDAAPDSGGSSCAGCDAALKDANSSSSETDGCVPRTCTALEYECGTGGDGCGGTLDCGTCTGCAQTCGGGGVPHQCGGPACCPKTCADLGYNCGQVGDGCGGTLNCGLCPTGQVCGGSGKPNVCGLS